MGTWLCHDVLVTCEARWVSTPALVSSGRQIRTSASGRWKDAYVGCGPEGYWAPLFYLLGRPPRAPDDFRYFRLMGRIAEPEAPPAEDDLSATFVLGAGRTITPSRSGRLYVFANDRWDRYFNNKGAVTLSVEQL